MPELPKPPEAASGPSASNPAQNQTQTQNPNPTHNQNSNPNAGGNPLAMMSAQNRQLLFQQLFQTMSPDQQASFRLLPSDKQNLVMKNLLASKMAHVRQQQQQQQQIGRAHV